MMVGGKNKKWNTLTFNGLIFPEDYKKHDIPIIVKNKKIILNKQAEEYATMYSKYINTEYVQNKDLSKIFNNNFWNDWKLLLNDSRIQSLHDCDFSLIYDYVLEQKQNKIDRSKEKNKINMKEQEKKFNFAIVDDKNQPINNYKIEPPGIFMGRGCNPKLGKIKKRIYPEDITINCSGKHHPVPFIINNHNIIIWKNHKWNNIIENKYVEWLASWKDDITSKVKYIWLSSKSDIGIDKEKNKFDLARKLKDKIDHIRQVNNKNLSHKDINIKQLSTALYFIDTLALRVGNEKKEDETDTVGVSSLRLEHIKLLDKYEILIDFLGKDSVRYQKKIKIPNIIYNNLLLFYKNKDNNHQIFDLINSNDINKYLDSFMKGLTAKVFRTFNASFLFLNELNNISDYINNKLDKIDSFNIILDKYNKANAKVAELCNHQKNISKNFNEQIKQFDDKIKKLKDKILLLDDKNDKDKKKINKLKDQIDKLISRRDIKIELKNLSITTSKTNYIDPRITVYFMKKHNLPIDKLFTPSLQQKFKWAFDINKDFIW